MSPSQEVAAPEPRRGMPSPQLDEAEFKRRFRAQFQDPAFEPLGGGAGEGHGGGLGRLRQQPQEPAHAQGRARTSPIPTTTSPSTGSRRAPRSRRAERARGPERPAAHPPHQLLVALRAHLSRRDVEELAACRDRPRDLRGRGGRRGRSPRPLAPRLRIRAQHPSLQGLLLDRRARSATGPAPAIRTIRSARRRTG